MLHGTSLESASVRPAIQGKQIERYHLKDLPFVMLYPYVNVEGKAVRLAESELARRYPNAYRYLLSRKSDLLGRPYFERSAKLWYELWNERSFTQQASPKIVVRELTDRNTFAISDETQFYLDTGCGIIPQQKSREALCYLLGLLNSTLLGYYYRNTTVPKASGFFIYKTLFLKLLPIRRIDFSDPTDREMHDWLVALVERMLELHRRKGDDSLAQREREEVEQEIARTDREIDDLVYDLYGLTEAERRVVQEAGGR